MTFSKGNTRAAKLSNEDVLKLREEYSQGASQGSLARKYGLSVGQVGRIVRGESRQVVPDADDRGRWRGQESSGPPTDALRAEAAESQARLLERLSAEPNEPPEVLDRFLKEVNAASDKANELLSELGDSTDGKA